MHKLIMPTDSDIIILLKHRTHDAHVTYLFLMISQISNDQSNNRPHQDNLSPLVLWMTKMKIDLIKFGLKTWQLLS